MKYLYLVSYTFGKPSIHIDDEGMCKVIAENVEEAIEITRKKMGNKALGSEPDKITEVQKITKLNPINPEALNE